MKIYPINIFSRDDLMNICSRIGTDTRALAYLQPKANIFHLFAENIDYRAAGFLKQEMLARGGDVAVTKHVIDGKADSSDVLIMATPSQLRSLQEKLKAMDCWGLKEFREGLSGVIKGCSVCEWRMKSPAGHELTLSHDTKIMAIVNLTRDSFFAASRVDDAGLIPVAGKFLSEGAYILDVGAESTRPGAEAVSESDELSRVVPAVRELRREFPDALISVDTYKPEVMRAVVNEGADVINDVSGFTFGAGTPETVAELGVPYVLSHIRGTPQDMVSYEGRGDILGELSTYFAAKLEALECAGVRRENVILDPGLGFGKSEGENFAVVRDVESLRVFGRPVLVGHSRKRFTGGLAGTLGVSGVLAGRVSLLRVHDVSENAEVLRVAEGVRNGLVIA